MALKATIYKADLQIADMDRHYYADHALTLARHPSETDERMMVRVLVYALAAEEGIAFSRGLSEVSEPEIWVKDLTGAIRLWIDLGQPDETRIRKACSRAEQVWVVRYGSGCEVWWKQIADKLDRHDNLTVLQIPAHASRALAALAAQHAPAVHGAGRRDQPQQRRRQRGGGTGPAQVAGLNLEPGRRFSKQSAIPVPAD